MTLTEEEMLKRPQCGNCLHWQDAEIRQHNWTMDAYVVCPITKRPARDIDYCKNWKNAQGGKDGEANVV